MKLQSLPLFFVFYIWYLLLPDKPRHMTLKEKQQTFKTVVKEEATYTDMKPSCTLVGRHTLAESIEEKKVYLKYLHDSLVQVKHSRLFE